MRTIGMSLAAVSCLTAACVSHRQVQYFEAVDPGTGNVNYYRMTLEGWSAIGATYQMQAGYFSAASVDVLRGQMPAMPEVDLPIGQDAAFEALVGAYYDGLTRAAQAIESTELPAAGASLDDVDDNALGRARLVWLGQLSPADVASMGMQGTTNPFQFRKLVFWTSSRQVDLREFGAEIDSAMASATALVRAEKAEAELREKRVDGLRRVAGELIRGNAALAPYAGLIDALFPGGAIMGNSAASQPSR